MVNLFGKCMLELVQGCFNAFIHGAIKSPFCTVPLQINAKALFGIHICFHLVPQAETVVEVFEVFKILVFDAKVSTAKVKSIGLISCAKNPGVNFNL